MSLVDRSGQKYYREIKLTENDNYGPITVREFDIVRGPRRTAGEVEPVVQKLTFRARR